MKHNSRSQARRGQQAAAECGKNRQNEALTKARAATSPVGATSSRLRSKAGSSGIVVGDRVASARPEHQARRGCVTNPASIK